jgi:hypothetical protein
MELTYRCPECGGKVVEYGNLRQCEGCTALYTKNDPELIGHAYYVTHDDAQTTNRKAAK